MAWLYNILKEGLLKDNQSYVAKEGVLSNGRFNEPIVLDQKSSWKKNKETWHFLARTSQQVSELLKSRAPESVVLFNERDYSHNTTDEFIQLHGTDSHNFSLTTGNLLGYLKQGEYSLKISSRFGDRFLKYIIADADGFLEIEDYGGDESGNYDWLLVYLWLIKLKRAYRLGLPKAYASKTEAIARVRGRIHPLEYFLDRGRGIYKCTFREHSYCGPATLLIAETFRKLQTHPFLEEVHGMATTFFVAAEGRRIDRRHLLATPHFTNPFYFDYNDLIDLSKRVLRNEGTDFGEDSETSAFFFDVSMLFEYFVRKLVKRAGGQLQLKDDARWNIPAGRRGNRRRRLEPDLVFEMDAKTCVFDVKYKSYDFLEGVAREDLFQLHTYVGQCSNVHEVSACGFIYPLSEARWEAEGLTNSNGVISDSFNHGGHEIPFYVFFIKVPSEREGFQRCFTESCKTFQQILRKSVWEQESSGTGQKMLIA